MSKVIIDGKAVYEIDEECIRKKEQKKEEMPVQEPPRKKTPPKKGCR